MSGPFNKRVVQMEKRLTEIENRLAEIEPRLVKLDQALELFWTEIPFEQRMDLMGKIESGGSSSEEE